VEVVLFYPDTSAFFDFTSLRAAARDFIHRTPLVTRAARGDRAAAIALHLGFWPFVRDFELAIDQHGLPRGPLMSRFGGGRAGEARGSDVRRKIVALAQAVREMKDEEGSHAAHWVKDASQLGLASLDSPALTAVQTLIASTATDDHAAFFAALAGTEFVAEELSARLVAATPFTDLFHRGRWMWGEIHLMPHDHGPSHLEIDMDLARAYVDQPDRAKAIVEQHVLNAIGLFEAAALEVNDALDADLLKAA
jgi:hypothetical protein